MLLTGVRMATLAKIQKSLCGILILIFAGFLVTPTLKAQDTAPITPTGKFGGVMVGIKSSKTSALHFPWEGILPIFFENVS